MSESSSNRSSGGSGCGCFSIIASVLAIWALLFGVTWNGKHYNIGCSCTDGVVVAP